MPSYVRVARAAAILASFCGGAAVAAVSCSPSPDPSQPGGQGGEGGLLVVIDAGDSGLNPDSACAAFVEQATSKPVNLYIMFDKSSSMVGPKWDSAKAGLYAFLDDPVSGGIRVALRFFPRDPDGVPACDQQGYKTPTVDFGELPGHAAALKAAMDAEAPNGFNTPMYPALGGALLKGIEVAENNPGEVSAVLLVTDGVPEGPATTCGGVNPEDPAAIAALAAAGYAFDPPVVTYVVGLPGVDQATANLIAASGGSDAAILVSATNVEEEFRVALAKIRGDALPCEYELPPQVTEGDVSISLVNVEITHGDGTEPESLAQNPDCDGPGWKYDDPAAPTAIVLCPETCEELKSDLGAAIQILLGCQTIVK
jgi:hypothetical protein